MWWNLLLPPFDELIEDLLRLRLLQNFMKYWKKYTNNLAMEQLYL